MDKNNRCVNRTSGFALVTSLLVLVVLAGLGAGAFFLTNMNLRIAENTRTSTIAQYNAHEGLDMVLLALGREFYLRGDGSWPSLDELRARMPEDSQFTIEVLEFDSPDASGVRKGGSVTVEGSGPRNARYETGARFVAELTPITVDADADPLFGTGWVSDSQININGSTRFTIPLWAGDSLTGSATKVLASTGMFAHSGFISGDPAKGSAPCTIHTRSAVQCLRGQAPPVVPKFVFEERRNAIAADSEACTAEHTYEADVSLSANNLSNRTICIAPGVKVVLTGTARGLTILGDRTSILDLQVNSEPAFGDPEGIGIRLAVGTVLLGGGGGNELRGANTIFAAESIEIKNIGADQFGTNIATLIGTERNVKIQSVKGTLNAVIWAKGNVCKQGSGGLNFTGSMLVAGEGAPEGSPCTQGIYWNGGGGGHFSGVSNPDIPPTGDEGNNPFAASGIRIVSRRP